QGRVEDAIAAEKEAVRLLPNWAAARNELAWMLATCNQPQLRDPSRSLEDAKKAVELAPRWGEAWNTLGVAHYRAGDCKSAIAALEKSMALRPGIHESFNTFFLAMAYWRLGEKAEARKWYDIAVRWMETNDPKSEQLRRFHTEAAELLGIKNTQ